MNVKTFNADETEIIHIYIYFLPSIIIVFIEEQSS